MTGGMESPMRKHEIAQCMRQVIAHVRRIKQVDVRRERRKQLKKVESNVVRSLKPLRTNVVGLTSLIRSSNEVRTWKMTEPEEASHEVPNKSGEMPTINALASMVQSVVQEMKAMNRRMDQLSEPVNLEDEEINYEEGELEHADADRESVVSLDTKVNEWTKAREAGSKNSKSTSALHDIAQDLDLSEKTGSWLTVWIVSSKTNSRRKDPSKGWSIS